MKLISMTSFIEWIKFENPDNFIDEDFTDGVKGKYNRICRYANFLNQPLTLGMFVPCDEEGNVLEEPTEIDILDTIPKEEIEQYQQAKDRVLFEVVSVVGEHSGGVNIFGKDFVTVEELANKNLEVELTPTALKQIGLTK